MVFLAHVLLLVSPPPESALSTQLHFVHSSAVPTGTTAHLYPLAQFSQTSTHPPNRHTDPNFPLHLRRKSRFWIEGAMESSTCAGGSSCRILERSALLDGSALRPAQSHIKRLLHHHRPLQTHRSSRLEVYAGVGNTFGNLFRVTTYGESHGGGVGCVIDGVPPRLPLTETDMQFELDRRRPGQSRITTPRKETDTCTILSGVADGLTLGTPIAVNVPNTDQRGGDYQEMSLAYRPSHADATYDFKYGVRAVQGGGRSSARETIGRVAAGAVAKKVLKKISGTEVLAFVSRVHGVELPEGAVDFDKLTMEQVEANIARCPDPVVAEKMVEAIDKVRVRGDSVGGVVTCIARNVPRGLGSPVFDKLEAELAKALMSLPATKGFEVGSGFSGSLLTGSEHNDEFFIAEDGSVRTRTNRSGGIQGGISNGETIVLRVAFKPTSTITKSQKTVTRDRHETELRARGRHDPCVVPRAVPMVEAMVALVLVDQLLQQYAQCQLFPVDPILQAASSSKESEPTPV